MMDSKPVIPAKQPVSKPVGQGRTKDVIPWEAGIQGWGEAQRTRFPTLSPLDSRFPGNDSVRGVGGCSAPIDGDPMCCQRLESA